MAQEESEPQVLVVAGCLFDVTFPEGEGPAWAWEGNQPEVTAVGESVRDGRRHFRFRAEEAAAAAGAVSLRFRSLTEQRGTTGPGGRSEQALTRPPLGKGGLVTVRMVVVLVAPERQPAQ